LFSVPQKGSNTVSNHSCNSGWGTTSNALEELISGVNEPFWVYNRTAI